MGITFRFGDTKTRDTSCAEFETDRQTVRLQSNAALDLSVCEAPGTLLFGESCGKMDDICTTRDKITQQALDRRLIQPEEARIFQNRLRNLFGEMSPDRQIDSKEEMEKLQRFEWDLSLKKIEPFIENSGRKETWLKTDATDLQILYRLIRHDFTFEGATEAQKERLSHLKETLRLQPWSDPEVLKHLVTTEIPLDSGPAFSFFFLLFAYFSKVLNFHAEHEEEIESAIVAYIRHYPEEVTTDLLGDFFRLLKSSDNPPGPLKKFLLGDETTPPSPILKQTLARSSWGNKADFLRIAFLNGHPDALAWVDSLVNQKTTLPKEMSGFDQKGLYFDMMEAFLSFVFSENGEYLIPEHLQPVAEKFRKKWRETLPEIYRKGTPSGFVLLNRMLIDTNRGKERFETLEREWELKQKKLRRPYTPPDFNPLIQPFLLSDPLSESLQSSAVDSLNILGEKSEHPIAADLAVEAFHNAADNHIRIQLFNLLGDWGTHTQSSEELREKSLDFFDTGLPISKILESLWVYARKLSELVRNINTRELRNSYEILREIALSERSITIPQIGWNSHEVFYTFESLIEYPDRYGGDPLETLATVILTEKNKRHAEYAFDVLQRRFESYVGEKDKPITDTLFRLAQEPHAKTIDAVNLLLKKAKSDSESELRHSLSQISIAGLDQGFAVRPEETLWAMRDLGILGHREAVGFLLEHLGNPLASINIDKVMIETKKGEIRQQICETATRKTVEEQNPYGFLILEKGARFGLEESYQGLLEVALSRESFSPMAVNELLSPTDKELPQGYWNVLEDLDADYALDIGLPVTTDQNVPSEFHDYAVKIVDLTGDSHIGKAITRFYNERDRMEREAEKIPSGEGEGVSPHREEHEARRGDPVMPRSESEGAAFDPLATPPDESTGSTADSDSSRSVRKTLTPPGSRITVEVVDLDRKFPHPFSDESDATTTADPADIADMILIPKLPFENLEAGLRFLIHAANLGDPKAQIALLTLIDNAADMARAGVEEGRIILQILAEEAPPFFRGQAQTALEE